MGKGDDEPTNIFVYGLFAPFLSLCLFTSSPYFTLTCKSGLERGAIEMCGISR